MHQKATLSVAFFILKHFFSQKLGNLKNKIKYLHSKNNNNHLNEEKCLYSIHSHKASHR